MNIDKYETIEQEPYRLHKPNKYRYALEIDSFRFLSKTEAVSFDIVVPPLYLSTLSTSASFLIFSDIFWY